MSDDEIFDVFDENEVLIGQERRSVVHRTGQWHRSTNVLIFLQTDQDARSDANLLLLQQRAANKDVCPNLWDLSCAEHVKCGETYVDAAVRGVEEELGLSLAPDRLRSLRDVAPFEYVDEALGKRDREFNVSFSVAVSADEVAALRFDESEVAAVKWLRLSDVRALMQNDASQFTPWCVRELSLFFTQ
jgi:isopentenyl-diphosphate delta-isomerase